MLTTCALVLGVLHAAPSVSARLGDTHSHLALLEHATLVTEASLSEAQRRERLTQLDVQLSEAPSGWPLSSVIGASVGFSLTGALAVTSLVLMFLFTGAEGAGVVLGVIVALVAILPLTAAIVFTAIGVATANRRREALDQLKEERARLVDQERSQSTLMAPGLVLARF